VRSPPLENRSCEGKRRFGKRYAVGEINNQKELKGVDGDEGDEVRRVIMSNTH
jgi:hypothetical protein